VDVYINYLRVKIDQGSSNPLIHTVRGVGYSIAAPESPLGRLDLEPPSTQSPRPAAP
jgi:DNA-binding winged helix-turn-helix (wHTH) protein